MARVVVISKEEQEKVDENKKGGDGCFVADDER